MDKKNLFSIGEIAKSVGVTRKIVLNYEAKGLITPDKKDGITGNRYYTIDTFTLVRTIRVLHNLGCSLDEIREYFNDSTDLMPIIKRLENMRDDLTKTIEKLYERSSITNSEIKEIYTDAQYVYCRTYTSHTVEERTILLRNTALEAMRQYETSTTAPLYYTETSVTNPFECSYCVVVPEGNKGEFISFVPKQKAISIIHYGSYETIQGTRQKLIDYANENNIKSKGVFRSIYLEGPPQHKDKNRFITRIVMLIE